MAFAEILINWYNTNRRILPWRNTRDPYKIWVSEIILQQTRVDQGLPYYLKFIEKYPDIQTLAKKDEADILRTWQGLGYYSRARNMHKAAKTVYEKHNGVFPIDYQSIRALNGIGDYTAAAIASFAFGLPYPVVDGNVNRLISRYLGISEPVDGSKGKKMISEAAGRLMDPEDPATFNQAIMEFGSLQCVPSVPDCEICPLKADCYAYKNGMTGHLPFKKNRTRVRDRYFNYLLVRSEERVLIGKRDETGIWKNMFELPVIETPGPISIDDLLVHPDLKALTRSGNRKIRSVKEGVKHRLSHQQLNANFLEVLLPDEHLFAAERYFPVTVTELKDYPVPKLIENYLNEVLHDYEADSG